jgi:uncharacterized repeat protein (TIGR02543 family)
MKDKTMRNFVLKMLGCTLAVLLIGGCEGPLSAPKQDTPTSSGRAIIRIGETGARSLVPTAIPDFSKYELVFSADGKDSITSTLTADEDRIAINGNGYAVELEEAIWTVTVSAFVSGTDTYLATAQGTGTLTISAATPNPSLTITLDHLAMDGAAKGIFKWNIDLSGITGSASVSGTITPVDYVAGPSLTWSGNWTQTGTSKYTSNSISHNGSTWETLVITAPSPCGITVTLTASSEYNYDYGYASRLDGSPSASNYQFRVSGTQSQSYTYMVPAGTHYLYFGYTKDGSESIGNDNVVVEAAVVDSSRGTVHTLSGATGVLELASGYYDLGFTVTKDEKSAGVYHTVHIYPGLTTTAEGEDFTFIDADFVEQKNLAGTVEITGVPQDKTVDWVKVQPYEDANCTIPLAEEESTSQNGSWLFTIPASIANVWFKVTMKLGGSTSEYDAPGASVTGLPAIGRKDIALSPVYRVAVIFDTGGGSAIAPVTANAGSLVYRPAANPAKTGYIFDGWYTAATGGSAVSWPLTVSENITVYARWLVQGSIKVTFSGLPQDETTNLTGMSDGTLSWTNGTLDISVPAANFSGASWQWYLDNAPLSGATTAALNKPGSDFTPGRHDLTVEIRTADNKVYSKTLRFTVGQ